MRHPMTGAVRELSPEVQPVSPEALCSASAEPNRNATGPQVGRAVLTPINAGSHETFNHVGSRTRRER
jgi:hypothetical protein